MKQQKFKCKTCGKIFIDPTYVFESDEPIVQHNCFTCAEKEAQAWLKQQHEQSKREPALEQVDKTHYLIRSS